MRLFFLLFLMASNLWARPTLVNLDLKAMGFSWVDLNVTDDTVFEKPLISEWIKWSATNIPQTYKLQDCTDECAETLRLWLQGKDVPAEFKQNAVLSIRLVAAKKPQTAQMSFSGGLTLKDAGTGEILYWADLPEEIHRLEQKDLKAYNSALVTLLYRYPLSKLLGIGAKTQTGTLVKLRVKFENPSHLGQVMSFMEQMKSKGAASKTTGKIDSFSKHQSILLFYSEGDVQTLRSLVMGINELESKQGLVWKEEGEDLVLGLRAL